MNVLGARARRKQRIKATTDEKVCMKTSTFLIKVQYFALNEVARHWFSEDNFTSKSWLPKSDTLLHSMMLLKFLNKIFHSNLIPFKIDLVFKGSFTLSVRSRSVCSSNVTKWDQQVCLNIFKNARQDVVSKNKKN